MKQDIVSSLSVDAVVNAKNSRIIEPELLLISSLLNKPLVRQLSKELMS